MLLNYLKRARAPWIPPVAFIRIEFEVFVNLISKIHCLLCFNRHPFSKDVLFRRFFLFVIYSTHRQVLLKFLPAAKEKERKKNVQQKRERQTNINIRSNGEINEPSQKIFNLEFVKSCRSKRAELESKFELWRSWAKKKHIREMHK